MTKCADCIRLATAHVRLEWDCIEAMRRVVDAYDTKPAIQYERLRAACGAVWIDSQAARLAYEQHRRIHSAN